MPPDLHSEAGPIEETGRERPPARAPLLVPAPTPGSLTPRASVPVSAQGIPGGQFARTGRQLPVSAGSTLEHTLATFVRGDCRRFHSVVAVAPTPSFSERSAASGLRSLRSPLRGLDPAITLRIHRAIVGATGSQSTNRLHELRPLKGGR